MLTYRLKNEREVRSKHQEFIEDNEREIERALDLSGRTARAYVQRNPGFKRRSGALQRETTARVVRTSSGRLLKLDNPLNYADAIDQGSPAHEMGPITPKKGEFLRFEIGGKTIFAKFVKRFTHPGNKPYKFMYRAHHAADRFFRQDMTERMTALAARF